MSTEQTVNDIELQRNVLLRRVICLHLKTLLRDLTLNSGGIIKLGCIGKDIDGVQPTTSPLFGDDGVVTVTSRLLATVFKRVLCKHVKGIVKSDLAAWERLPSFLCLPSLCKDREMLNTKYSAPLSNSVQCLFFLSSCTYLFFSPA